jgi:hypothetical protein
MTPEAMDRKNRTYRPFVDWILENFFAVVTAIFLLIVLIDQLTP